MEFCEKNEELYKFNFLDVIALFEMKVIALSDLGKQEEALTYIKQQQIKFEKLDDFKAEINGCNFYFLNC